MRYAISVPNYGDFANPAVTIALARDIEAAGWDAFFLWDHVLVRNGNVVADPWTLLAAIAVSTERILLGTMVTPLPRRRPWQVVRQIVTLDHLSGGRAMLGVGIGYPPKQEYEVFGESGDARVRAELLDEGLDVVTGLMSGRPFSYDGRHFHLDRVEFKPQPVQRPRVPIWVAGTWPYRKPFRRAARYDGVVPIARDANEDESWSTSRRCARWWRTRTSIGRTTGRSTTCSPGTCRRTRPRRARSRTSSRRSASRGGKWDRGRTSRSTPSATGSVSVPRRSDAQVLWNSPITLPSESLK